ncbi:MAG: DUF1987 domain-containing protein [Bacteroidales bacterium]
MESLTITGTNSTPQVSFNINGRLSFEGRSLPENAEQFYKPLQQWLMNLSAETVKFDINLEYFNSASSKKILDMLKTLDANSKVKNPQVNWHYEEDDDDTLEAGQIFEEFMNRIVFRFLVFEEAA